MADAYDQLDEMIKKTGCFDLHEKVQVSNISNSPNTIYKLIFYKVARIFHFFKAVRCRTSRLEKVSSSSEGI